jgi:hypothetical protein
LYWKSKQEGKGSQAPREEKTFIQEDLKATAVTLNVAIHGESADEVKARADNWTQSTGKIIVLYILIGKFFNSR